MNLILVHVKAYIREIQINVTDFCKTVHYKTIVHDIEFIKIYNFKHILMCLIFNKVQVRIHSK